VPQLTGSEIKFREWRYNIPLDSKRAKRLSPSHAAKFWQTALELLDGDAGVVQEVVNLLAGDGGMLRIAELLDHACEDMDGPKTSHMFTTRLLPFFKAVSHTNVITSAVLEGRLVSIYNFVFGHGGQRGAKLFTIVSSHLASIQTTAATTAGGFDKLLLQHFEASIMVLSKIVESNTTAQVNEELPTIVKGLRVTVDGLPDIFEVQALSKKLNRIEQRLGLGEALPAARPKKSNQSGYATFTLAKPLPGDLSEDGPRHDNDHAEIREISILPTEQEIQSARGEYLPLSDPAEWHLSGLPGLLDRHFRLLREDTVGQLRDAAKFELERLSQTQVEDQMPTQARQGMRTNVYENLTIENAEFDVFRGLQFVIGFDQPKHLANKSKRERQEWWEGSRRMGSDALVCLLSSTGSATFLVVTAEPFSSSNKKQCPGVSQLHVHYNLWDNTQRAYIIAQLVKEDDVRPMLHEMIRREMHLSLVEFPGVLLPAFMPTLKALQRMSTSLDLPFVDVLIPGQPAIAS